LVLGSWFLVLDLSFAQAVFHVTTKKYHETGQTAMAKANKKVQVTKETFQHTFMD
jgi:hypothetical protein